MEGEMALLSHWELEKSFFSLIFFEHGYLSNY